MSNPGGWYADPFQRFEHRYWDGRRWTEHVSTNGIASVDQPAVPPSTGAPQPTSSEGRTDQSIWAEATIAGSRLLVETSSTGNLTGRTGLAGEAADVEHYIVEEISTEFICESYCPDDFMEMIDPIFECTGLPLGAPARARQRSVVDPNLSTAIVPGVLTPPIPLWPFLAAETSPSSPTSLLAPWLRLLARPTTPPRAGTTTLTTWFHPETTESIHGDTGKYRRVPGRGIRQAGGQLLVHDDRVVLLTRYDLDERQGLLHRGSYVDYEISILKSTITEIELTARYSTIRPLPAAARAAFDARGHGGLERLELQVQFMTGWGSAYAEVTLPVGGAAEQPSIDFARWVLADVAHHRVTDLGSELSSEQQQWILERAAYFPPPQMYRTSLSKQVRSTVHLPLLCARNFGVPISSAALG